MHDSRAASIRTAERLETVPSAIDAAVATAASRADGHSGVLERQSRYPAGHFEALFGASAPCVIAAMDAASDDVVDRRPEHGGIIDAVGLTRTDVPVAIRDPFGSPRSVTATAAVTVRASVPTSKRGLHLSRIGTAVADAARQTHGDLTTYAIHLAETVAASQYGRAHVSVRARLPYVEDVGTEARPVEKRSLEHLVLFAAAMVSPVRRRTDAGIRVGHLVACPCVQMTYKHALGSNANMPPAVMTHSQRCHMMVILRDLRAPFRAYDALEALDAVLVRTCNTLPRDRELACVYRAHRVPQFIEDAVRAAVHAVGRLWPPETFHSVRGRARSIESIHEYDLTASMTVSAATLAR